MGEGANGDLGAVPIGTGTVLLGAERFSIGNISATYRGSIQMADVTVVAVIKDIPAKELANELLAASIAIAVGLPIPTPVLAFASKDTGIGSACPLSDGSGGLVFGSVDVGGTSVRQIYMASPQESTATLIAERLAAWDDAGRLYGFDSWIANIDRNAGNLQFGGAGGIWLIDHARGFTGSEWVSTGLDPSHEYANQLAKWLTPSLTPDQRGEMAKSVGDASDRLDPATLDSLAVGAHLAVLLTAGDRDAVVNFLADRMAHVPRLASRALGFLA